MSRRTPRSDSSSSYRASEGIAATRSSKISDAAPRGTRVEKFAQRVKPWSIRDTPDQAARNLNAFIERHARDADHIVLIGTASAG